MVALMVGRKLEDHFVKGRGIQEEGFFQVEGLRTSYRPHHRVSFEVAKGEILGFAGLVGEDARRWPRLFSASNHR